MNSTSKLFSLSKKRLISALFLLVLVALILPAVPAKAVTIDATATICKGRTTTLHLKEVPDGYKVKWKNTKNDYVTITSKRLKNGVARCKVKGKKTTKSAIIKGKLYNKSGKLVHTYNFKVVVKAHNYKVTRKSTCQKKGKKVCERCKKTIYLKKKAHTYRWVYGDRVATGSYGCDDEIDSYRYKKLTSSSWDYRDDHICYSFDLADHNGTPYSHVASLFTEPYPKTIKNNGKVFAKVKTWTVDYSDTDSYDAQGGTWSGFRLLDRKLSRSDTEAFLDGYFNDTGIVWSKFDSVKDIKGYTDDTRRYAHEYSSDFFGDTWQNTYGCRMWSGKKAGEKRYVLMFSDSCYRYFVYTYKATCH